VKKIAILGGTGLLGSALAYRLAKVGYEILIGSRNPEKAFSNVSKINKRLKKNKISVESNYKASEKSELIILTVPFANHLKIIQEISTVVQHKILIDTTVPLVPPIVAKVQLPEYGSVAKKTQELLGKDVYVVSAFQNIAASHLDLDETIEGEVLVFGNNKDAREKVISIIKSIGLKGWHSGSIDNSIVTEALTSTLIFMNKYYKIDGSGIKIVGIIKSNKG